MANAFDIDKVLKNGVDQNVDTHLLNETFHVFSKSPASNVTTLGGARLKSGHTTTVSDVWADEIPAFFSAANQAKFDLFGTLAVKDDLCIFGGKVYQHNGEQFVSLGTEAEILVDGATFQKNNKDVIKYHKNRTAINLTADNNNGDGSNDLTAKIYDAATGSTNFVSQFISSTDKIVAGVPSLAYDATVIAGDVKLAEGLTNDNDYICNSYAGVIQFNKARSQGSVTVSAWEYIGGTLSESLDFNEDAINDIEDKLKSHKEEVTAKNKTIHVNDTDRDKWDTAATKAGTAIQTVKRADNSSTLISVNQSGTNVSISLSNTVATKTDITSLENKIVDKTVRINPGTNNITADLVETENAADSYTISVNGYTVEEANSLLDDKADKNDLSSHTSNNDIHITADERSKWNTASQKTDRLSFPTTYTNFNDNQCYVTSYGFEYKELIEDAWIQNIEVNVALPELRDSLTEYNPISGGSPITPNTIGEKVCKILVTEGLNDDWGENFNKDDDEIELGTSEYNICEKDKNNSLIEILNFTFDQPIFLRANKNYRFYFYDQNENLYALPIIINVDDANNITTNKKEVAIRCLIDRYDYAGVWNIDKDLLPDPYGLYGLKVKLSKDIYSAFIAHENNSDIHITESEREKWNTTTATATTLTSDLKTIIPNSYSVKGVTKTGGFTTFVLPNNFCPTGVQLNAVKIKTIGINSTPTEAYLGVMAFYPDGTKKKLSISDNTNITATRGYPVWYFSTPFTVTEDYKLVFYILKDKESFIEPEPIVDKNVAIGTMVYDTDVLDPYYNWATAQTDLNLGFHINGAFQANNSYPGWPECTLYEINHINNNIKHFKEGEHEQLFSDEKVIFDSEKNVLDVSDGTYYGIQYKPSETFKFDKISIVRNSTAVQIGAKYLFIFKQEGESKVFIQKCITRPGSSIENNVCYWEFEPTLLEKNISYFLIFRENENEEYSKTPVALQALQQSTTSESLYFINDSDQKQDAFYVPNIKIYGEGRLFATIDELDAHTSDNIIHVTQAEKDIWNAGGNALQEIIEGDHIEVDGNTVGVNTSSLVADTIFTTKVNELATAKANTAVTNHENSTTKLHVTQTEKNTWNSKLSSVSASSNNDYVGATVNNGNSIVISPDVVTDISAVENGKLIDANTIKSYVDEHTSDGDIHVTIDDKNNWNTSNIEYKALNKDVTSYKDGVLTYRDGTTENINLEKTISAQYAFGKYSSSSANTISEFNLRTIKDDYTANDGANYENDCVVSDDETVSTLANLINGRGMFLRSNLTTFNDELPCLILGDNMFKSSTSLSNFRSPLPSLTCASGMFRGCTKLTIFRTKLPSLSRAKSMFNDDDELTIVDTCLPNLTYGNNMFSNCPKLTIVNLSSTSLSNLYDGTFMFHHNTARDFNKFKGDLSSLETAEYMFTGCRLDLESVTRIADTIRDWSGDNSSPCEHRIGIGVNSKSTWTDWNAFEEQKTRITNKGWIIAQWQENGVVQEPVESSALTYYYAKPASGYASPEYIDENGNKVTLILTHYTDCKDEYEIVSSREEAEIRFNLTKIEKVEE